MTAFDPVEERLSPTSELDELGPAEWAFTTLQRIAAWGFHDSRRHELRVATLTARERYRAATSTEGDPR